jgi:hypothetical protein
MPNSDLLERNVYLTERSGRCAVRKVSDKGARKAAANFQKLRGQIDRCSFLDLLARLPDLLGQLSAA